MTNRESRKIARTIYTHYQPPVGVRYSAHWSYEYSDGATAHDIHDEHYNYTTSSREPDGRIRLEFPLGIEPPKELWDDTDRFVHDHLSGFLALIKEKPGVILCTKSGDKYQYRYLEEEPPYVGSTIGFSVPGGETFGHTCCGGRSRSYSGTINISSDGLIIGMNENGYIYQETERQLVCLAKNHQNRSKTGPWHSSHTRTTAVNRTSAVSFACSAERPETPFRHIYRNLPRKDT